VNTPPRIAPRHVFLSIFSGTHFVTPRAVRFQLGVAF
jgi:hypothetical protein